MSLNKFFTGAITTADGGAVTAFGALAAKAVLANSTNASGVPAALAGNAAFQHLRVNSANTGLEWAVISSGDFPANTVPLSALPTQAADTFLANVTAGSAVPTAASLATLAGGGLIYGAGTGIMAVGSSTSIVTSANDVQRAALSGAITAAQDSNVTAFGVLAAKGVLANATNASAVPAALAGSAAFQHLRVNSGNTGLEWATLQLAEFPTMATGTFLANITAGTAVPIAHPLATFAGAGLTYTNVTGILAIGASTSIIVGTTDVQRAALTGEVTAAQNSNTTAITRSTNFTWTGDHVFSGEIWPYVTEQTVSGSGPLDVTLTAGVTRLTLSGTAVTLRSVTGGSSVGRSVLIYFSGTGPHTVLHQGLGVGNSANIFNVSSADRPLPTRGSMMIQGNGSAGWRSHSYGDFDLTQENNFWSGENRFGSNVQFTGAVAFDTVAAGGSIGAQLNNFNPGDVSVASFNPSAAFSLTGIVPPDSAASRCVMILVNLGSTVAPASAGFNITLIHDNNAAPATSSTASNRFYLPGGTNRVLTPHGTTMIWYDNNVSRWRLLYAV